MSEILKFNDREKFHALNRVLGKIGLVYAPDLDAYGIKPTVADPFQDRLIPVYTHSEIRHRQQGSWFDYLKMNDMEKTQEDRIALRGLEYAFKANEARDDMIARPDVYTILDENILGRVPFTEDFETFSLLAYMNIGRGSIGEKSKIISDPTMAHQSTSD